MVQVRALSTFSIRPEGDENGPNNKGVIQKKVTVAA